MPVAVGKENYFLGHKDGRIVLVFGIFLSLKNGNCEGFGGMLLVRLKFATLDVLEGC